MKNFIALITSLIGGVGAGLAISVNPIFALLMIPVVLFILWIIVGLYLMDHWEWEKFKKSMWNL